MDKQEAYWRELGLWPRWMPRSTTPSPSSVRAPSVMTNIAPTGDSLPPITSLSTTISSCTRCPLHEQRRQAVVGLIRQGSPWMFIGEAPGAEEDRLGQSFVGAAGQLLDQMLRAIGVDRSTVSIANIIKCRPPHNRTPTEEECQTCLPYLEQQIAEVQPRVLVLLGKVAAQTLLKRSGSMADFRHHPHIVQGIPTVVTWHPAYLLRSPQDKSGTWQDLCRARQWANSPPPTPRESPGFSPGEV